MLTANEVAGYRGVDSGVWLTYGPTVTYNEASLRSEILGKMINSPRVFKFDTFDDLETHVEIRESIVHHALDAQFGFSTNAVVSSQGFTEIGGTIMINKGPFIAIASVFNEFETRWKVACQLGASFVALGGVLDVIGATRFDLLAARLKFGQIWQITPGKRGPNLMYGMLANHLDVKPNDWIPGDLGYIQNNLMLVNPMLVGNAQQGENIIYLGAGMFWGHGEGIMTLEEFMKVVRGWSKGADASLDTYRLCPLTKYRK